MKKLAIFFIVILLSLSGLILQGTTKEVEAEKPISAGNILYVDRSGGSTYTQISAAISAANPGDTIYVAPGSYGLISVGGKSDLSIIGNGSQGEVVIYGSAEFIPLYLYQCSNITMTGFYFNGEGTTTALLECQGITFGLNRFQSLGILSEAISIRDSDEVTIFWSSISSTSRDTFAIELDNSENFFCNSISVNMTGTNAGVIEVVDSDWTTLNTITGTYSGDFIDAQGSNIKTIDTVVPDSSVSIDPTSSLLVEFFRRVIVMEEDNESRLQGVEFELKINNITEYSTPYYGGTFYASTEDGIYEELPNLVQKIFTRNTNPIYLPNTMKFYYSGLDVPTELDLGEVDAGTTDELHVIFPDMRLPEPPQNVSAKTVDHDTIQISFDASPSDDVDHYEVWQNDSSEWVHMMDETVPGNFDLDFLESATYHEFRVRAVDDAGLNSTWIYIGNRTDDPIDGRIFGNVTYQNGPLDGLPVVNASVVLGRLLENDVANTTTDASGRFDLGTHSFMDSYLIIVSPPDYVESGSNETGYTPSYLVFDHQEDTELEILIEYYEFQPPTKGNISGQITYKDGPLMGENATNTTVFLLNETLVEIENMTVNETGLYQFRGIPFGYNYTMWVIPENNVGWNGTESGYVKEVLHFFFDDETVIDVNLSYFNYSPPTWADIYGRIVFEDGPKSGEGAYGASVELLVDGNIMRSVDANITGHFLLDHQAYGTNFSLRITPSDDDLGEMNATSGYLPGTITSFDHLSGAYEVNVVLDYYEYVVVVEHPSVVIKDDNGDPLSDVVVVVTINGTKYSDVTDENGVAEFDDLVGTEFPDGATFKATVDGYEDLEWTQGDEIPEMVEEEEAPKDDALVIIMVIGLIIILIVGILFFLLRKSGVEEEEYTEE